MDYHAQFVYYPPRRADEKEHATPLHSCQCVFIDRFILRPNFLEWDSRGSAMTNRKKLIDVPGARFSKVPRTFRARKAIRKATTCLFCKAGLFICCKGDKSKYNCKVSCLETPSFWRYKKNYVTRNMPEKVRDFRETGARLSNGTRKKGIKNYEAIMIFAKLYFMRAENRGHRF